MQALEISKWLWRWIRLRQCGATYKIGGNYSVCCIRNRFHFGAHRDYAGTWVHSEFPHSKEKT